MDKMEELKENRIDELIERLEELKKADDVSIDFENNLEEIATDFSGKSYAKKILKIDITYKQLYVKNDNDLFDYYKSLKREEK